jgi:flavin-dependent dehydrogenase
MKTRPFDVAVIGGGPAGATAARLLAEWDHSVVVLSRSPGPRPPLAESIPPSARKVLAAVGALGLVEAAGFATTTGNTSWWGTDVPRVELFQGESGWQVLRADLETLLLQAVRAAGAEVRGGVRVRRARFEDGDDPWLEVETEARATERIVARHVLDASGRSGVIACRGFRLRQGPKTLALSASFRREGGFAVPDDSHTLVESFDEGWAFSISLAPGLRHATVVTDPPQPRDRPRDRLALYLQRFEKARCLSALFEGAARLDAVWATDASTYTARQFAGERFALVGDAASFLDPLSSFGVKKALASGWLAAVAAHTALRAPARAGMAAAFFSRRESQVYARYATEAARVAAEATAHHAASSFWRARAEGPHGVPSADDERLAPDDAIGRAFEALKAQPRLRLRLGNGVGIAPAPAVIGREIAPLDALVAKEGRTVHFVDGISAAVLARLAPGVDSTEALYDAYNRAAPAVALGAFLRSLSTLLAAGLLREDETTPHARAR